MNNHYDLETLHLYYDKALPPQQLQEIRAHLTECPECAKRIVEFTSLTHYLREEIEVPENFKQSILDNLPPRQEKAHTSRLPILSFVGLAACAALAVALYPSLSNPHDIDQITTRASTPSQAQPEVDIYVSSAPDIAPPVELAPSTPPTTTQISPSTPSELSPSPVQEALDKIQIISEPTPADDLQKSTPQQFGLTPEIPMYCAGAFTLDPQQLSYLIASLPELPVAVLVLDHYPTDDEYLQHLPPFNAWEPSALVPSLCYTTLSCEHVGEIASLFPCDIPPSEHGYYIVVLSTT